MVRLKEKDAQSNLQDKTISIPDGSIKRGDGVRGLSDRLLFQFQMVRLKASVGQKVEAQIYISIPDGSIKRTAHKRPSKQFPYFNSRWFD